MLKRVSDQVVTWQTGTVCTPGFAQLAPVPTGRFNIMDRSSNFIWYAGWATPNQTLTVADDGLVRLVHASGFTMWSAGQQVTPPPPVTDLPVPADYDGDGKLDLAVYRPTTGTWYVLTSRSNYAPGSALMWTWGTSGDVPVPADYDGDGRADPTVWRPGTPATWYVRLSSTDYWESGTITHGQTSDVPVPGDYDGDGKADLVDWRPANGTWYGLTASSGFAPGSLWSTPWGGEVPGDVVVPGEYDGDGKMDPTIWRSANGYYYVRPSSTGYVGWITWPLGNSTQGWVPVRVR
ncbi:MAG TPA: VCBS repeat-containing protein [Vicinamibacterales bacterium]